ncbi:hypothetical protein [Helicobacter sp. T3_23-1059]
MMGCLICLALLALVVVIFYIGGFWLGLGSLIALVLYGIFVETCPKCGKYLIKGEKGIQSRTGEILSKRKVSEATTTSSGDEKRKIRRTETRHYWVGKQKRIYKCPKCQQEWEEIESYKNEIEYV